MAVETGDGYKRNYQANNTGESFYRAGGGAITRAVAAMLNDKDILDYIEGKVKTAIDRNPVKKLQMLKEMKDKGLITPDEYEQKKSELLEKF